MSIKGMLISVGLLGAAFVPLSAEAASFSYDLSGDASAVTVFNGFFDGTTDPYQEQTLKLTNVATGLQQLSPITIAVGDSVNVSVSLTGAMTIPASIYPNFSVRLFDAANEQEISVDQSVSFFSNGALISVPGGLTSFGGSQGFFTLGGYGVIATPSFSFDKITVSAIVTSILDKSTNTDISPLALMGGSQYPYLSVSYGLNAATTPIPGAALLMLTGLGSLAGVAKVRRRMRAKL